MVDLQNLHPIVQAFIAALFCWGLTALGATGVFFFKKIYRRVLAVMLGLAAGVMVAASIWSLLIPAIEMSTGGDIPNWVPAAVGFLAGGFTLLIIDRIFLHRHFGFPISKVKGLKTNRRRTTLLVLAITLHNIPEGLAVGVAFGAVATGFPLATLAGAVALTIGIGIQDIPEGLAISVPLRRDGMSRLKSFWYGQISAVVEPIAAVIGAAAVIAVRSILPYALAFAAGAMIFVVIKELIPESQSGGNGDVATVGAMLGFVLMMVLDVAFS
jgi:ZIP family zinc transporter